MNSFDVLTGAQSHGGFNHFAVTPNTNQGGTGAVIPEAAALGAVVKSKWEVKKQAAESEFAKYYAVIVDAKKTGTLADSLDPVLANTLLMQEIQQKNLGNAVWLLRHGADLTDESGIEPEFLSVLKAMSQHKGAEHQMTPADLNKLAIDLGYGFKTANLTVIQSQLDAVQKKVKFCDLKVPPFQGISHHEIEYFLKQHIPDMGQLWDEFLKSFPEDKVQKFLLEASDEQVNILISQEGKLVLAAIQEKIKEAFVAQHFSHIALDELVDSHDPQWIIVRSTGKEDSKDNANAGGNDSIPFIAPNQEAISKAIGQVVASYFGEKSIIQRLQAGDKSLFKSQPFMPVLLQAMVCEKNASGKGSSDFDIPCSGVLFTREQGKDENVVTINAARGSNEGVVASQVVTDTYQVHPQGTYAAIRVKPSRFVHIPKEDEEGFTVGAVKNETRKISHGPALSHQMVQDLATLARELGMAYAEENEKVAAMDMEFTIMCHVEETPDGKFFSKPTIYPLQIRPLQETKKSVPGFLKLQELQKMDPAGMRQVKASTLLDGGSELKLITKADLEVIVADDITEALQKYQKHEQASMVKAIIIRQPAPLTSHECVTLRPKGIPVLVIENEEDYLQAQLKFQDAATDAPTVVCPQRGLIFKADSMEEVQNIKGEGLISYPGPVELTLKDSSIMTLQVDKLSPEDLQHFLEQLDVDIDTLVKSLVKGAVVNQKAGVAELLDQIAMGDEEQAKAALAELLKKLQALYHKTILQPNVDKTLALELVECMHRIVRLSKGHMKKAIETEGKQSMGRLFPLKALQALIMQRGNPQVVRSSSFLSLLNAMENSKAFDPESIGLPKGGLSKIVMTFAREGTREEYREKWNQFLGKVYQEKGMDGLFELKKLMADLGELNLKTYWFNVTFQDYAEPTLELVKQDIEKQKGLFEVLKEHHATLANFEQCVGKWSDPDYFKKQFKKLEKAYQNFGFDDADPSSLAQMYQVDNPLGNAAVLEFFHKAMEVYDHSIKAVSGSDQFTSKKEQAQAFATMLEPYFSMLRTSTHIALPHEAEITKLDGHNATQSHLKHGLNKFETYLKYMKSSDFKIQRELSNPSQSYGIPYSAYYGRSLETIQKGIAGMEESECAALFEAREKFNVAALALGSHTDLTFCIYWPQTLEELFTTYHQSMEGLVKLMKTKNGLDKTRLPESIKGLCEGIEKETEQSIAKMSVNNGVLEVVYNIPFRSHASEVVIRTDLNNPDKGYQIFMTVYGNEETNRWKMTATFGALLAQVPGCSFHYGSKPKINYVYPAGTGVSMKFHMSPEFKHGESFGTLFKNLLMKGSITFDASDSTPNQLIKGVAQKEGFKQVFGLPDAESWLQLPESFYANALFPNIHLLRVALNAKDNQAVAKIVKGTFAALASYGLEDLDSETVKAWNGFSFPFNKSGSDAPINEYYAQLKKVPPFSAIAAHFPKDQSYVKALMLSVCYLYLQSPQEAKALIQALKMQPKVASRFKKEMALLESIVKEPKELVEDKILAGNYSEALMLARNFNEPSLIQLAQKAWKKHVPEEGKGSELLKLVKMLHDELEETAVKELALNLGVSAEQFKLIEASLKEQELAKARGLCLKELAANGASMHAASAKAPTKALMRQAKEVLIGLSQSGNLAGINGPGNFLGIEKYLGAKPYVGLLKGNNYATSAKLYKAATFLLLKGMLEGAPGVAKYAAQCVADLSKDHAEHGKKDKSAADARNCILTIVAGYKLKNPQADVSSLLADDPELIGHLKLMLPQSVETALPNPSLPKASDPVMTRENCLAQLPILCKSLFAESAKAASLKLATVSMQTLIALVQHKDYHTLSLSAGFNGLEDYLGKAPYDQWLVNNIYPTTNKLYKAATFSLLKALQSPVPEVSAHAEKCLKELVADYIADGHKDLSAAALENSILTLVAGYLQTNPGADIAALLGGNGKLLAALEAKFKIKSEKGEAAASQPPSKPRERYLAKISHLGHALYYGGDGAPHDKLMVECAHTLIGLSQSEHFLSLSAKYKFKALEGFLGVKPYKSLLVQNKYGDTTKLYKAATFYLLKGLLAGGTVAETAKASVSSMAEDYVAQGHKDISGLHYQNCLFTIVKGYELSGAGEEAIAELLGKHDGLIAAYKGFGQ